MSLGRYKQKRTFDQTPEPKPRVSESGTSLKFVIQKHAATRLHYDFRLEVDGVLKSWAVPKGPPMNTKDKRLAMMVEDHPYEYKDFEGVIPKDNYGAGTVMVWDEGNYSYLTTADYEETTKLMRKGLREGEIKILLNGKKLKGGFALIKMKSNGKEDNAWLMIKEKDQYAKDVDITKKDKSAKSGLSMNQIAKSAEPKGKIWRSNKEVKEIDLSDSPKSPILHDVKPMLATLVDEPFDDPDWLFEIKWDGFRAIAEIEKSTKGGSASGGKKTKLYSRNLQPFNELFAPIVKTLNTFPFDAVLDGEVVVIDAAGKSHFQLLQNYQHTRKGNLVYYVFDILYLNKHNLQGLPLLERKKILKKILPKVGNVKFSDHVQENGIEFFAAAHKQNLEGIIAKNSQSEYKQGKRSDDWFKIKTHLRQEAVIGGFTEPKGGRKFFGALILGLPDKQGRLRYVGHTGGGFNQKSIKFVYDKLKNLIQEESPFNTKFKTNAPVTWVRPKLLAEVSFSEWTQDGQMRQPIFLGIREDKSAVSVVREGSNSKVNIMTSQSDKIDRRSPSIRRGPSSARIFSKQPMSKSQNTELKIGKVKVEVTHLDKVFWPKEGYTKGDLIEYYRKVSKYILPHLKDRPESLNRHPNGIEGKSFFQKDVGDMPPEWVKTVEVFSESNNKNINYLVCDNEATLIYMANLGCIEINPWNSRIKNLDKPDYAVIDLDPEKISFEKVIEAAQVVHKILDKLKVPNFCKTSGATGLHIYIPLGAKYTYEQTKQFAELVASLANKELPKTTSLERSPAKRQKRIYLDYLQNRKGQTLAAPYSVRPKPGATVSTPLEWKEVKKGLSPSDFTIKNIFKRLDKVGDLWKPVLGKGINLKKVLARLGR